MRGMNIGLLIRLLYRNVSSLLDEKLKSVGISQSQLEYFMAISGNEGINQKALAETLHVGKTSSTKAVKRLIDQGLVYREPNEDDQRHFNLYITEKGDSMRDDFKKIFLDTQSGIMSDLSDQELEQLQGLLERLLKKTDAYREKDLY
ncbi:MarR family winged helix-turn-helix transcriptional regulator [Fusibacter sp. JL216-2]|uniref:MarR family winged helix-turn-helix transcriptional regulator n=1 Tax=Fusibacter sp. JL216-2 TaxID=3071453 RepID=UPI003D33713E